MVQNAKDFNDPDSQIFEDAERIRKLVFNFMKQNNPAYKDDPNYSASSTPIPAEEVKPVQDGKQVDSEKTKAESRQASEKPRRAVTEQSDKKSSTAPSATTGNADDDDDAEGGGNVELDFDGKTFQDAQQLLIAYLLNYQDEE